MLTDKVSRGTLADLEQHSSRFYVLDVEIPFTISHENQEEYLHKLDPTEWKVSQSLGRCISV